MGNLLSKIDGPEDLRELSLSELNQLAQEVREEIVQVVAVNGGHLSSNLGTVELTLAMHYVFDTPTDKIVWDVGHQSYAHKLITGRRDRFHTLRQMGGISGFPSTHESEYDCFDTGHASTAISAALGMASGRDLNNEDFKIIAFIGDGSLTGGMTFEALNNAGHMRKDLIVVLNDNEMAISRSVGALSAYLSRVITAVSYNRLKGQIEYLLKHMPMGTSLFSTAKRIEKSVVSLLRPGSLFEELGFKYVGPIDGHDLELLIDTMKNVARFQIPIFLHVLTTKGKGYAPAESDPGRFHSAMPFDIETGNPLIAASDPEKQLSPTYSQVFGDAVVRLAETNPKIVAITAAMPTGTGLDKFAEKFPDRFYDVGIAEGHAVTFAAGLASQGLRPIVAVYSTFLQRAYDQILHDVCLQNLPVVFALDRAGIVGGDGPTHQGLFDISYLRSLPNMTVTAPKDENELVHLLRWAVEQQGPVSLRYPRDRGLGVPLTETYERIEAGKWEVLREGNDVGIIALGSMVQCALEAAERLQAEGISCWAVNARFVRPLDGELLREICGKAGQLIIIEDHVLRSGLGSAVLEFLEEEKLLGRVCVSRIGFPDGVIEHAPRSSLLEKHGLSADGIANTVRVAMGIYSRSG